MKLSFMMESGNSWLVVRCGTVANRYEEDFSAPLRDLLQEC